MKNTEVGTSVKQSVTSMKNTKAGPSVKQSVTQKMPNVQDSFRSTQMLKSPISQIKRGVKKLETHTRRLFFPHFIKSTDKTTTEIEMCDTLPDLPDIDETEFDIELCDTLDTLPDLPNKDTVQTNGQETKSSQSQIEETGFDEGDPVLFFLITNSTRRNIAPYFGLMDMNNVMRQMPNYRMGGTAQGLKPPDKVFVIRGDSNCYFRALSLILTGTEIYHVKIRQAICDFIEVHYNDLNMFLDKFVDGEDYLLKKKMRENGTWGTELEIIVMATMAKRDVIMYNHTGYLRYQCLFAQAPKIECFFIDNRAGGHFNEIREI